MKRFFLAFLFLTHLLVTDAQSRFTLAEKYYGEALDHYRSGRLHMARASINQSIHHVSDADAYCLSGRIYEAEGKPLRAVAEYEAVVRIDPNYDEAVFQKALIYLQYNDAEQALVDFNHIINRGEPIITKGIYFEIDPSGAEQNTVVTLSNLEGRLYDYRGQAFQKLGKYQSAMSDFSEAISLDAQPDFYVSRGLLYNKLNQQDSAVLDFKRALKLQKDHQLAWYNLALLEPDTKVPPEILDDELFSPTLRLLAARAFESGDFDFALGYYNRALAQSKDALSLINRGRVLMKLNRAEEARSDFQQAKSLDPTRFEVYYLIGNSFFYAKSFEPAIAYYNQYLTIDPSYALVWYNAAMAYLELDQSEEACQFLAKARELGMTEASEMLEEHCL